MRIDQAQFAVGEPTAHSFPIHLLLDLFARAKEHTTLSIVLPIIYAQNSYVWNR